MAQGLIKKQIIHYSSPGKRSPIKGLFGWTWNKKKRDVEAKQEAYDTLKSDYAQQEYVDPYEDVQNPYARMQTQFENVYEDATINQQQAEFMRQTQERQRATYLSGMQQSGGVGAGDIQALANLEQQQQAQASATIGQQEQQAQQMAMGGAADVQRMEQRAELQQMGGQFQAEEMQRKGQLAKQQFQFDKQATLLGMGAQELGAAQQALANRNQMWANVAGSVLGAAGSIVGGGLGEGGAFNKG